MSARGRQTAIWAHPGLRFDPLPVLQDYTAFTPSLDQLDTHFLRSSAAPRYILRQPVADRRAGTRPSSPLPPSWRSSAGTAKSRPTRYGSSSSAGRTGAARPDCSATVTTGLGHWVTVPPAPAGDAIVASFQLPDDLWSKLQVASSTSRPTCSWPSTTARSDVAVRGGHRARPPRPADVVGRSATRRPSSRSHERPAGSRSVARAPVPRESRSRSTRYR